MTDLIIGIFVGGAGKRMGGVAKGSLKTPAGDETLLTRLLRICADSAPEAVVYLVGQAPSYATLGLTQLADEPREVGPIGGLRSLLRQAQADGARRALALACDLPFIDQTMIRLLSAPLDSAARVPVVAGRFQPLAATYAPIPGLAAIDRALAANQHALMRVLAELGTDTERFEVDGQHAHAFRDWDTPDDIAR
ncbi:MAG TPA: molybdenum cofactor guanylyltransferase [Polyangiaceae bacterium]|nr:molybdenum cofactor guanylyltransferase [Polyangiaceae bacterium]